MTYLTLPHEDDAALIVDALHEHAAALRRSAQVGSDSVHVAGRHSVMGTVPRETQQVVQAGTQALLADAHELDELAAHIEKQMPVEPQPTEPSPCSCHARQP